MKIIEKKKQHHNSHHLKENNKLKKFIYQSILKKIKKNKKNKKMSCIHCGLDRNLNGNGLCEQCVYCVNILSIFEANDVELAKLSEISKKLYNYISNLSISKSSDIVGEFGDKSRVEEKYKILDAGIGINDNNICKICELSNFSIRSFCDACLLKCDHLTERKEIYDNVKKLNQSIEIYQILEKKKHRKYAKEFWDCIDVEKEDKISKIRSVIKNGRILTLSKAYNVQSNTQRVKRKRANIIKESRKKRGFQKEILSTNPFD